MQIQNNIAIVIGLSSGGRVYHGIMLVKDGLMFHVEPWSFLFFGSQRGQALCGGFAVF
jgi:hypothetical protein